MPSDLYAAVRWYLRRWVNPDDLDAVLKYYDEKLSTSTGYFETKVPGYIQNWPTRGETQQKVAELTAEMKKAAQPKAHEYEIKRVK